ncbi:hypothetical protein NRB_50010 [Novosphingobium sp. 11B]
MHVLLPLKQNDRLIGGLGFQNGEAGILQDVDAMHSDEHIVFDNEDGLIIICWHHGSPVRHARDKPRTN